MDVARGNEVTKQFTCASARKAKSAATGWFHLNNAEETVLENDIVAMLEAEAEAEEATNVVESL